MNKASTTNIKLPNLTPKVASQRLVAMEFAKGFPVLEELKELIKAKADVNAQEKKDGNAALHGATIKGNEAAINMLIRAGADVNIRNYGGFTPLHAAVMLRTAGNGVIKQLLKAGANPNVQDYQLKKTPIMRAADLGNEASSAAMVLAKAGAYIDVQARKLKGMPGRILLAKSLDETFNQAMQARQFRPEKVTAHNIILLANIGQHHTLMRPDLWRNNPNELAQLLDGFGECPWLKDDILNHQPSLTYILANPQATVSANDAQLTSPDRVTKRGA